MRSSRILLCRCLRDALFAIFMAGTARLHGSPAFELIPATYGGEITGYSPSSPVIKSTDGLLYGTTSRGGRQNQGTLYSVNPDGSGCRALVHFGEGGVSYMDRISDGGAEAVYGISSSSSDEYTIYKVNKNGTAPVVLKKFPAASYSDPWNVRLLASRVSPVLYGTLPTDNNLVRILYRINTDGTGYKALRSFTPPNMLMALTEGSDGVLYGVTTGPQYPAGGTVFALNGDGAGYRTLHTVAANLYTPENLIEASDGVLFGTAARTDQTPVLLRGNRDGTGFQIAGIVIIPGFKVLSGVTEGADGMLYGAGFNFDTSTHGIFRVGKNGSAAEAVYRFTAAPYAGWSPAAPVVFHGPDVYFLMTSGFSGVVGRISLPGRTLQAAYTFPTGSGSLQYPHGLMESDDGFLYTMHSAFGSAGTSRLKPDGSGLEFLGFNRESLPLTGDGPYWAWTEGRDGWLYGVSQNGGSGSVGSVVRFAKSGSGVQTLASFSPQIIGIEPTGSLTPAGDGSFWGVTSYTGRQVTGTPIGGGLVFKCGYVAGGAFTIDRRHQFSGGGATGSRPFAPPIVGSDGRLYGTTSAGGPGDPGTIYSLNDQGWDFRLLWSGPAGATLMEGSDGFLYGAYPGGGSFQTGSVFRLRKDGSGFTALRSFPARIAVAPVEAGDGRLYAAHYDGSAGGNGMIYSMKKDGSDYAVVHVVDSSSTGGIPAGFIRSRDGLVHGVLTSLDQEPSGALFRIRPGARKRVYDGTADTGALLSDGQSAPVDFGRHLPGTSPLHTFSVVNAGTVPLRVGRVTAPAGFTLVTPNAFPAVVSAGASVAFEIGLQTQTPGVFAGSVTIESDDYEEQQFDFPVRGEIFIPAPGAVVVNTATQLNRQTGLREQTIRVSNDSAATVPAYTIIVRGLPEGVMLYNASEVREDGSVLVHVLQPLGPQAMHEIVLEYYSANRQPADIAPQIGTEVLVFPPDRAAGAEETFAISQVRWLPGPQMLLEFTSTPGRFYRVQYSHDNLTWCNSLTRIRAAGSRTQWLDRGPPQTDRPLSESSVRFYRVQDITP